MSSFPFMGSVNPVNRVVLGINSRRKMLKKQLDKYTHHTMFVSASRAREKSRDLSN